MSQVFLIAALFIFLFPVTLPAQEDNDDGEEFQYNTVVKVVDGLKFNVPEDRPIEKKDGVVMPMPIDKYVALKFSRLGKRLEKMEDSIRKIQADLSSVREDVELFKKEKKTSEVSEGPR